MAVDQKVEFNQVVDFQVEDVDNEAQIVAILKDTAAQKSVILSKWSTVEVTLNNAINPCSFVGRVVKGVNSPANTYLILKAIDEGCSIVECLDRDDLGAVYRLAVLDF